MPKRVGGFFAAAALNFTVGASYGWRAMFLCGLFPVVVAITTLFSVKEPERWQNKRQERQAGGAGKPGPFTIIFNRRHLGCTVTMSGLATVATVSVTPLFFGNGMVVEEAAV